MAEEKDMKQLEFGLDLHGPPPKPKPLAFRSAYQKEIFQYIKHNRISREESHRAEERRGAALKCFDPFINAIQEAMAAMLDHGPNIVLELDMVYLQTSSSSTWTFQFSFNGTGRIARANLWLDGFLKLNNLTGDIKLHQGAGKRCLTLTLRNNLSSPDSFYSSWYPHRRVKVPENGHDAILRRMSLKDYFEGLGFKVPEYTPRRRPSKKESLTTETKDGQ